MLSTSEPTSFRAGETVEWTRTLPEYPNVDGWSLKYRIFWPSGASPVDLTATGNGTEYAVNIAASSSAAFQPGQASLWSYVERAIGDPLTTERIDLGVTQLQIDENLLSAGTLDSRSPNQRALDDLRAALSAYVAGSSGHVAEYQIGDRTMRFRSLREITDLIAYYEKQILRSNLDARPRVLYRG